jgi:hypothetical protein
VVVSIDNNSETPRGKISHGIGRAGRTSSTYKPENSNINVCFSSNITLTPLQKQNYDEALKLIQQRFSRAEIDQKNGITALDDVRLEFYAGKNGKRQKYIATPDGVFRVISERAGNKMIISREMYDDRDHCAVKESDTRNGFVCVFRDDLGRKMREIEYSGKKLADQYFGNNEEKTRSVKYEYSVLSDGNEQVSLITDDNQKGSIKKSSYQYREDNTLESITTFKEVGVGRKAVISEQHREIFDLKGRLFGSQTYNEALKGWESSFIGTYNNKVTDYLDEKKISWRMSESMYLDMLAQNLDSYDKLAAFFKLMMTYEFDSPNPDKDPYKIGSDESHGDYWQLPAETIKRLSLDKTMMGDCEDWAFLAKEILNRQGKNAFVLHIPGHALCLWVEKKPDGRFNAYALDTFGFDRNGNLSGVPIDTEKEKGYVELRDAVNSVLAKYDKPGKIQYPYRVNPYKVNDHFEVMRIPEKGKKENLQMPLSVLADKDFNKGFNALEKALFEGNNNAAKSIYRQLAFKHSGLSLSFSMLNEIFGWETAVSKSIKNLLDDLNFQ